MQVDVVKLVEIVAMMLYQLPNVNPSKSLYNVRNIQMNVTRHVMTVALTLVLYVIKTGHV